jgi:hypothetical protein
MIQEAKSTMPWRVYRRLGKTEDASKELRLHQELKAAEEKSLSALSAVVMGN